MKWQAQEVFGHSEKVLQKSGLLPTSEKKMQNFSDNTKYVPNKILCLQNEIEGSQNLKSKGENFAQWLCKEVLFYSY